MKPIAFAALLTAGTAFAQSPVRSDPGLAAVTLSDGESVRAIAILSAQLEEFPNDPALLINLGIAFAQSGNDADARSSFQAAMASRQVIDLETADGTAMDSRRLARRALSMLDRGEFRSTNARSNSKSRQFSLNR
jgi:Flp pilus assembly protein TadD